MVSLARRLRERLFWPSERSMQKLMGRIDSLENENNRLRDALQAQEMILHEIRDAISGMQRINEDSCRSLNEMQRAQIQSVRRMISVSGRNIVFPARLI